MLPMFPTPRKDELLYSIFSRYHHASRNPCVEHSSLDLFGTKTWNVSRLFGTNLEFFCSRLDPKSLLTPNNLINNYTLLPLFRPFMPPERVQRAVAIMMDCQQGNNIHTILGINSFRMPTVQYLRFCPACVKDDLHLFDNQPPSWYRCHQVQGVNICHRHLVWLQASSMGIPSLYGKRCYDLPDKTWAGDGEDATGHKNFHHYKYLADTVHWFLNKNIDGNGLKYIANHYANFFRLKGLMTVNGWFRQKQLTETFLEFYNPEFLAEMNSQVCVKVSHSWLNDMLRPSPFRVTHPCQHLLVMRAFGILPEHFFYERNHESVHVEPFGPSPWPCLNRASDHYLDERIKTCEIKWRGGKYKGQFHCQECGYTYCRSGPDLCAEDRMRHSRITDFGPVWREYVYNKIVLEGVKSRQLARELGTFHSAITRQIKGYVPGKENKKKIKKITFELIEKRKKEFLYIRKTNPSISRTELYEGEFRKISKWLYRNDKEWFINNLPPKRSQWRPTNFKDWEELDRTLAPLVRLVCLQLLAKIDKPIKITKTAIIRIIGYPAAIYKQLHKLPRTSKTLDKRLETTDKFHIRMLPMKAVKLIDAGRPVTRWSLLRSMGIKSSKLPDEVEAVVIKLLDLYG